MPEQSLTESIEPAETKSRQGIQVIARAAKVLRILENERDGANTCSSSLTQHASLFQNRSESLISFDDEHYNCA